MSDEQQRVGRIVAYRDRSPAAAWNLTLQGTRYLGLRLFNRVIELRQEVSK